MTEQELDSSITSIQAGIAAIVGGGQSVSIETVSGKRTITRANLKEMYELLKLFKKDKQELLDGGGLKSYTFNAGW